MKPKCSKIFFVVLTFILVLSMFPSWTFAVEAEDSGTCGDKGANVTWTLDGDGTLTISGNGAMKDYKWEENEYSPWDTEADQIKKIIVEEGVTTVGRGAFMYCDNMTSITLPDSLTEIKPYSIVYCSSLSELEIPDGVTDIGEQAFVYCDSLTNVDLSDNLKTIGYGAFGMCDALEKVIIPSNVESIGEQVFYECSSLVEILAAEGNENFCTEGGVLFNKDKTTLISFPAGKTDSSFSVPSGVKVIFGGAFAGCTSLIDITLPEGLIEIGDWAFDNVEITTINIPDSVEKIGRSAFVYCYCLEAINVSEDNPNYCSEDGILFTKDKKNLIYYPIGNTNTIYKVPDGVTEINYSAISENNNIVSVVLPESLEVIREFALSWNKNLKEIVVPDSVTTIERCAFYADEALETLQLGKGVKEIGEYALSCLVSLKGIQISEENPAFSEADGVLFNKDKTVLICCPAGKSGAYSVPEGVTEIGIGAFENCENLTSIEISKSVRSVCEDAFYYCVGLKSLILPSGVTTIGKTVLEEAENLNSIIIPESVTEIDPYAFSRCSDNLVIRCHKDSEIHKYAIENELTFAFTAFDDVSEDAYYCDAVMWAAENCITGGVDGLHFDPKGITTRAQMVTFLWRAAGCPEADGEAAFTDVDKDKYYSTAVAWAVEKGITNGTSKNKFSPNATVTRAQAVTFLQRMANVSEADTAKADVEESPFVDISSTDYYYNAVLWAKKEGISDGTGKDKFSPNATCTRAQVVTLLYRVFEK